MNNKEIIKATSTFLTGALLSYDVSQIRECLKSVTELDLINLGTYAALTAIAGTLSYTYFKDDAKSIVKKVKK